MRYPTEPRLGKYVKGYGLLPFSWKFANKYGKKLMDPAIKTGTDAEKTASKRVVQKSEKATRDLIGNKLADQITQIGKPKAREKQKKLKKFIFHQKKDNKLLMTWDYFGKCDSIV